MNLFSLSLSLIAFQMHRCVVSCRYCLFGDTMNTAARMQQNGLPGCIHTTREVVGFAPDHDWEKRKQMLVKGKGVMQTYLLRVGSEDVAGD